MQDLLTADTSLAEGFKRVRFFVLDEADRLLEQSFESELRIIAGVLPAQRQTLLFSATLTRSLAMLQASSLRDAHIFQVSCKALRVGLHEVVHRQSPGVLPAQCQTLLCSTMFMRSVAMLQASSLRDAHICQVRCAHIERTVNPGDLSEKHWHVRQALLLSKTLIHSLSCGAPYQSSMHISSVPSIGCPQR